jgi:hypothetical protein
MRLKYVARSRNRADAWFDFPDAKRNESRPFNIAQQLVWASLGGRDHD